MWSVIFALLSKFQRLFENGKGGMLPVHGFTCMASVPVSELANTVADRFEIVVANRRFISWRQG